MRPTSPLLSLVLLAASAGLFAQSPGYSSSNFAAEPDPGMGGSQAASPVKNSSASIAPLSRLALGAGFSPLGVNLLVATNINRRLNLRGTGNFFQYSANNISTNGFNVDAKIALASAGASLDVYPFPNHGFRLSPGALFYNTNAANAVFSVKGGTSFTLDNVTYYASATNPVKGTGAVGLHTQKPAFTITTGWGNVVPSRGGHWSFPFELGVAFIGAPTMKLALTQGQVCDANGLNCVNVATDQALQTNLQAQVDKYIGDLEQLKTYPIVSIGVAYSFRIR